MVVWDSTDEYSADITRSYRKEADELLARDKSQRQTLLRTLITGMATERDLAFAATVMDLPDAGPYLVAVADARGEPSSTIRTLTDSLGSHGVRSEWLHFQERLVGLLAPRVAAEAFVGGWLQTSLKLRIGLSPSVPEFSQVAAAYRQAELAFKSIPPNRVELASLDSRLTNALLVASPELARRLIQHVLGPIIELAPPERALLLETLRAYISQGGSVAAVARELACHRNTVLNRLSRIKELTGLAPADPTEGARVSHGSPSRRSLVNRVGVDQGWSSGAGLDPPANRGIQCHSAAAPTQLGHGRV